MVSKPAVLAIWAISTWRTSRTVMDATTSPRASFSLTLLRRMLPIVMLLMRRPIRHKGALEIHAVELGVGQDRARQSRLGEVRSGEIGPGEIGAEQIGAGEIRAFQVGFAHYRVDEAGILKVCALQIGAAQRHADEVGALQFGALERGIVEPGAGQDRLG